MLWVALEEMFEKPLDTLDWMQKLTADNRASGFDATDGGQPASREGIEVLGKPWEAGRLIAVVKTLIA